MPHIVLIDRAGTPIFSMNETEKSVLCLLENRCPICGQELDAVRWFVGGPLSAFHEDGWYNDTAMHHECMEYALRVCPYLAAPSYSGKIDAKKLTDPDRIYVNLTMLPGRPQVFVAVGSETQEIRQVGFMLYRVRPTAPFAGYEFWQGGEPMDLEKGMEAALASMVKTMTAPQG